MVRIKTEWPARRILASQSTLPPRVPDRSLTTEEPLPTIAIRAAGTHQFVYRKMLDGPVGAATPNHGDIVRVVDRHGVHLGYALWNGRSQISLRFLSRKSTPPGLDFWSGRVNDAVALRTTVLGLETRDERVSRRSRRGGWSFRIDRRPVRRRAFGRGVQPGNLPADRPDPVALRRPTGTTHFRVGVDERVAQQEDFSGRPLASPRLPPRVTVQEHGIRYRIHFEGGHKTGFFCDQRDSRRDLARFCAGRSVLDLCCYTGGFGLNALIRGQARDVTCVDLDEKAVALARENGNANNVRLDVVHADAFGYARQMAQNAEIWRGGPRPSQADPRSRRNLCRQTKVLRLQCPGDEADRTGGLLVTCSCSGLLGPKSFWPCWAPPRTTPSATYNSWP